jgi:hypothetical protein
MQMKKDKMIIKEHSISFSFTKPVIYFDMMEQINDINKELCDIKVYNNNNSLLLRSDG